MGLWLVNNIDKNNKRKETRHEELLEILRDIEQELPDPPYVNKGYDF